MTENSEIEQTGGAPEDLTPETKPSNNPDGRPTLYKDEYVEQVYKLCLLGATDLELADFFEVTEQTITNWKHEHPEFFGSIKEGKEKADIEVAESLLNRAKGYEWKEQQAFKLKEVIYENGKRVKDTERIEMVEVDKVVPPDTTAIKFWLTNRKSQNWKDKRDHELSGELNIKRIENVIIDPDNPSS